MLVITSPPETAVLSEADWHGRQRAHEQRVRAWTDPHQARTARGERHPVFDFLFEYYAFRPAWLRRWHPGPDLALAGPGARAFLRWPAYRPCAEDDTVRLDPATLPPHRRDFVAWLRGLLQATQDRTPFFGCFGLHEWAMVYRQPATQVRHAAQPLRLSPDAIARVVEASALCCSHFDAFRFFTPEAAPRNRLQPARARVPELEQRGCLHANMDLYKWAFKLVPYSPSDLVADCFEFACAIRTVDMRASPYDLTALGFAPIPIETAEGRAEYESHQRDFAARSSPLRTRLIALCDRLLANSGD